MGFYEVGERAEEIGQAEVSAAYKVHVKLGPGLLEKIYEACMAHELRKMGFQVERQAQLSIFYDGIRFDEGLRIDLLVEDQVIVELKAVDELNAVWQSQIISHLHLAKMNLGYLINFNVPIIKKGIKRFRRLRREERY